MKAGLPGWPLVPHRGLGTAGGSPLPRGGLEPMAAQRDIVPPPRVPRRTGHPSGNRSGVHLRKSGHPRSRSTMVQGARVAWQRVWLGSSTCPSSHLGM